MARTLLAFRNNVHSQNGEDGVLAELFRRLNLTSGWFCEFGAWDGKHLSNSFAVLQKGWSGVMIEGDANRYEDLKKTAAEHPGRLYPLQAFVAHDDGPNNLDRLLARTPIPKDFDLLSIDIDSSDWQVWNRLRNYAPKVVVIEIDSSAAPGVEQIHGQNGKTGSSFTSTGKLGKSKGYELVCHTGNMIFVRNDLMAAVNLPAEEIRNPDSLFLDDWVTGKSEGVNCPKEKTSLFRKMKSAIRRAFK
jgi:hypothetical protein